MEPFSTRLVFAPPPWPVALTVAALVFIAADIAAVLLRMTRGGLSPAGWVLAGAWVPVLVVLALLAIFRSPAGAVIAIAACGAAWAVRSYARTTSPIGRGSKALLLSLRVLAVLLAALWVLRPTLESRRYEDVYATVLVGIDTSGSMANPDVTPELRPAAAADEDRAIERIAAVQLALRKHHADLEKLAERCNLRIFTFAADAAPDAELPARPGDWRALLPPADHPATAIGDAAYQAVARYLRAGRDVAAVLLISDGASNTARRVTPRSLGERMRDLGVEVHALCVGRTAGDPPGAVRVLNIAEFDAPTKLEKYNKLPISAVVEMTGLVGKSGAAGEVEIKCRFGDELLKAEKVCVTSDAQTHRFSHEHVPIETGTQRLKITASLLGPMPRGLRGRREAYELVHVTDHGLRVLYVEGKFRYEAKYIARALAAARGFTVRRLIMLRPLGAEESPELTDNLEDWLRWHAIIIGDVPPEQFTDKQLEILRKLVDEYGKGFCMIGGRNTFERGLWAGTPVAKMMPVDLSRTRGEISRKIRVTPTEDGLKSDLMRFGTDGPGAAAAWTDLDELPGASRLAGVKPAAEVLAETGAGPDAAPLIVRQRYGQGRTLAIAFDTTWRWVLSPEDTAELQKRFWRQVVLYLAAPKGSVWIETDRPQYDLRRMKAEGESVLITAGLEDSSGTPVTSPRPEVVLVGPDGAGRAIDIYADEARAKFHGVVPASDLAPTDGKPYVLKVKGTMNGKELSSQYSFAVVYPDLDSRDVEADLAELQGICRKTGGECRRLDQMDLLLRRLRLTTEPRKELKIDRSDLGESLRWPAVGLIIALLCAEWAIRKRRGLV